MAEERKGEDTFRVFVHRNEAGADGQALKVSTKMNFKKFKKAAAKKLKVKSVKRVYLSSGVELNEIDDMQKGDMLYCSSGDAFYRDDRGAGQASVETLHVAVLGGGHVGKSALTLRFVRDFFVKVWDATIEDAYKKTFDVDGQTVELDILDTAGQEDFESLRPQWMMHKDGYVFAFALNKKDTLSYLQQFYELHKQINETRPHVPIILCGTKADLVSADPKCRQVSEAEGKAAAERFGATYIETSAATDLNVREAFSALVRAYRGGKPAPPKKESTSFFRCAIL